MHRYTTKTIVQTLLVLSVLNLVYAGPAVPWDVRDTGNNVVVVAEDVTTGSDRRRATPGGTPVTTPSQHSSLSSPDGSPPHDSLPLDESASLQGSESSSEWGSSNHLSATDGADGQVPVHDSTWEASTSAHPLSAAVGPAPVHDSTTEASTSAHPLSAADGPALVPDSITGASTSSHHSSATDGPAPVPDSITGASTPSHHSTDGLVPIKFYDNPRAKKAIFVVLLVGLTAASVLYMTLHKDKS